MTATDHPCPEPLVLTWADRQAMKTQLQHDADVIAELAELVGQDDLGPSNLVDDATDRVDPIAGRVLRRRLIRAVLRHSRRAARLAELLLELPREPDTPQAWHDRMAAADVSCSTAMHGRH